MTQSAATKPAPNSPRPMSAREWAMILTVAVFWGGSYFFTGVAVRELPVFTIVMARYVVSTPLMLLIVWRLGQRMPWREGLWKPGLTLAVLNQIIPFSLITWGQGHIPSAVASILNASGPIVTIVLAHVLTHDEKLTTPRLIGVLVGFAGIATMIGAAAMRALDVDILAQLACIAAVFSYAYANLRARGFNRGGYKPTELVAAQIFWSGVLLAPLTLIVDQPWTLAAPSAPTWLALFCLGFFSSTLGHLIYFKALSTAGSTNISVVSYLMPATAILLGATFLGERLQPRHFVGMALIAAGLAIMDGRLLRVVRRAQR